MPTEALQIEVFVDPEQVARAMAKALREMANKLDPSPVGTPRQCDCTIYDVYCGTEKCRGYGKRQLRATDDG